MTKIIVTGGSGMIGNALKDIINDKNIWIFLSSKDCDLTKLNEVEKLFQEKKPDFVIHLAANVGGLFKNIREKILMFRDNVRINENVLECCNKFNVQKGIFCLSTCIYPYKPSKYPMNESMVHESEPHPSNEGYGYSKRMMEMQCRNYNEQFGREYICVIPVNLYGPHDNFNLDNSHVVPGLIHRFYNAKKNNKDFYMYGHGRPLRQLIYSYDFAKILIMILFEYKSKKPINCCNDEISIKDLTFLIGKLSDYDISKIKIDESKPEGCFKKTVDGSYFNEIFPNFKYTKLEDGLFDTIKWFNENYEKLRK